MRINEIEKFYDIDRSFYVKNSYEKLYQRFKELGIEDAAPYLANWIYTGRFNLSYDELDQYEAAFYLIRSILPNFVLASYNTLPVMYRGMRFSKKQVEQIIQTKNFSIKSRIMSWSPSPSATEGYVGNFGVILKHKPVEHEVIISLNQETKKFLEISSDLIVNKEETILSLPILDIKNNLWLVAYNGYFLEIEELQKELGYKT